MDVNSGRLCRSCVGHEGIVTSIAFDSEGRILASAGFDHTINLWDIESGQRLFSLEGHTDAVVCVDFSCDGRLLASTGYHRDRSIRLWRKDNGVCIATISGLYSSTDAAGIAFHPYLPFLATVGSDLGTSMNHRDRVVHIWELDIPFLLSQPLAPTITYTSAKIVLVGDSGVGKTGLGWRLAHEEFKEHSSTHGQQFWLLNQLCKQRSDGAQCEAVLWDPAGQPDYRLIHALFLDDADLALVLFDPTRDDDPLSGVEFWLKQLKVETKSPNGTPTVLIAARSDRGAPRLTLEELNNFCKQRGIKAYILTSAKSGEGIEDLVQQMQNMILWDENQQLLPLRPSNESRISYLI